jgi:hypothetical protein
METTPMPVLVPGDTVGFCFWKGEGESAVDDATSLLGSLEKTLGNGDNDDDGSLMNRFEDTLSNVGNNDDDGSLLSRLKELSVPKGVLTQPSLNGDGLFTPRLPSPSPQGQIAPFFWSNCEVVATSFIPHYRTTFQSTSCGTKH